MQQTAGHDNDDVGLWFLTDCERVVEKLEADLVQDSDAMCRPAGAGLFLGRDGEDLHPCLSVCSLVH